MRRRMIPQGMDSLQSNIDTTNEGPVRLKTDFLVLLNCGEYRDKWYILKRCLSTFLQIEANRVSP
jgi:hypothetical protein